jgi:dynein heavy chain
MTEVAEKYAQKVKTLPKGLKTWPAFLDLQASLEDFLTILPMLQDLAKPSMKKRHWDDIMTLTQKPDWFQFVQGRDEEELDPGMKLRAVLEAGMLPVKEDVEEVIVAAEKQKGIRDKLNEIKQIWDQQFLEFAPWKARQDTLLSAAKNGLIIEKLEESITTVGQLLSMKHVKPFQQEAQDWFAKLNDVSEVLEGWIKTQLSWTALEPVFTGGDIARQMPQISKIFSKYDKEWATRLMPKAKEMKNVVAVCRDEYIKGMLPEIAQQLETCQKALDGYLETKRNRFPRFYFVSNPALLLILSRGSDLVAVQECFQALFDSITNVTFKGNMIVKYLGLQSGNGNAMDSEEIDCIKPVSATGNIEDWLNELEKEQYVTMKAACKKCALECVGADFPLEEFAARSLGQFALLGIQFAWTHAVETALKTAGKPPPPPAPGKTYKLNSKQPLKIAKDATVSMMEKLAVMTLGDIPTRMERTKIETLVTIQVHARDVLEVIIDKWAYNLLLFENTHTDFEWQKQARFYWNIEDDACQIRVADTMNPYCYEYLGCKERLCITPLTDRCYIALTQALAMYFGGAPAGPAGTGKTETVKDLGRGLGKYVVVMNCSDQMRYTDTAKIFKGLCMSGSWGCFDEFNRIDLEVLSVVAQQVMSVLNAFKANAKVFSFPDSVELVTIDRRVGFFITMNPGYAGRQELPENLKALFRGVTMMVPDFEIIIKVKLASCGYLEYNPLAKKFKVLYDLCKEQLSKQRHYDFGLRNILSVLRTAGSALRVQLREDKALKASKELEEMLLMRTLRDINLSKFVSDDVGLFRSLLGDLFPEQPDPPIRLFTAEEEGMEKIVKKEGLQYLASWKLKMVQLFETSLVRHGLMMIGPAGSGKTKAIDVLLEALTLINNPHKIVKMNPKAITATEMFGENDRLTGEWIWGIFPEIWKKCNDLSKPYRSWIICDGPVDAVWIENLNTVLDDNKLLTLANGDRYKMTDNCKILFEAEDLRNASPATVSRAGMCMCVCSCALRPFWGCFFCSCFLLPHCTHTHDLTFSSFFFLFSFLFFSSFTTCPHQVSCTCPLKTWVGCPLSNRGCKSATRKRPPS